MNQDTQPKCDKPWCSEFGKHHADGSHFFINSSQARKEDLIFVLHELGFEAHPRETVQELRRRMRAGVQQVAKERRRK